jgi:alpha-mannosidase
MYGNHYFRREFGKAGADFMLPDCFGFPASLPSLLAHCGLEGFSTQKLTWQSAAGIPFNVGFWEGLDGTGVIAAFNAGDYTTRIREDLSRNQEWLKRITDNGEKSGIYADYLYYGTGDEGGAPAEISAKMMEASVAGGGPVRVISATADQMFTDMAKHDLSRLPRYRGDLLLTEHSAGSITSAAYMKRWNFQNELMADAAERASVLAAWIGGPAYPQQRLNDAWMLVLGGQFHDILPGTSHPKAYEYSWNDELLALNQFACVLENAVGAVASALDTRARGAPLVVYNPLSIERQDVVEACVVLPGPQPSAVRVFGPDGKEVPAQVLGTEQGALKILFLATAPSVGYAVYDVQAAAEELHRPTSLKVSETIIENDRYRLSLDANGDVAGILDKIAGREMLSAPSRLAILHDFPKQWPAWNVDWEDRQKPPRAHVGGPAKVRIVEKGPVRAAVEVVREGEGSRFAQTIRLSAGDAGNRIEILNNIEWQGRESCLKAVFPLAVANPQATYNWDVGTIERGNNDPKKYEVPSHQWFDLTDAKGDYGVTVLSDCKYGSDKPDDHTLRLTLLRTPGARGEYQDQARQDWGRHEILYGLAGHSGGWRQGQTDWQAWRMSQPLMAFQTTSHDGPVGRSVSLLKISHPRVRVLAVKKAEDSDEVIVRLVELDGKPAKDVHIVLPTPILAAREVNGQELPIGEAQIINGELVTELAGYRLRTFALRLGQAPVRFPSASFQAVRLPYDRCVTSDDNQKASTGLDSAKRCLPAEMLPGEIIFCGATFSLAGGDDGQPNAVTCRGQEISLPTGPYNRLYLLATSGNGDCRARFSIDGKPVELNIQDWSGFIGQWDNRTWSGQVDERAFPWPYEFTGLRPAYLKPAPVAWFCSHRHNAEGANEYYSYCYLYAHALDLPAGAKTLRLPENEAVVLLAATAADDRAAYTRATRPLLDEMKRDDVLLCPNISPADGEFTDATSVTIEHGLWGGGHTLRYTLDRSEPTVGSPVFAAPLVLHKQTTVKARLFDGIHPLGTTAKAQLVIKDTTRPTVEATESLRALRVVRLKFSEPLEKTSAENTSNYLLRGAEVESVVLSTNGRVVVLTLKKPLAEDVLELSVQSVRDLSPAGNVVASTALLINGWRPLLSVEQAKLDGEGGGYQEMPLDGSLASAAAPWTINLWLWLDRPVEEYTVIAGFGSCETKAGTQRYLTRHPSGLCLWGAIVGVETKTALDVGQWQMLTATFDGATARVYKNGLEVGNAEIILNDASPVAKLGPPPPWRNGGFTLGGRIKGFTLWNRALSAEMIAALRTQDVDGG